MSTVQNLYRRDDVPLVDYDAGFPHVKRSLDACDAQRIALVAKLSENARDRSYSVAEVADLLDIAVPTIHSRIHRGKMPFTGFRIGWEWRFAKHDVHAWIDEHQHDTDTIAAD
jgi:excisionase family DNA binding protein